ncbi:unnamed protein product, partial [Symbiodinium sp. CCMP2456]
GHVRYFEEFHRPVKHAALVTGCSTWWLQARHGLQLPVTCQCGLQEPSRPHLLWSCQHTRQLGPPGAPTNRVEERLLAKIVEEMPAPPLVLDVPDFVESLAEEIGRLPEDPQGHLLATDGSAITEVASAAIAFLDGEDQTPYRAEVQALLWLYEALLCARRKGLYFVVVDCMSAIDAVHGHGRLAKILDQFAGMQAALDSHGVRVVLHWTPSHGKKAPDTWRPPGQFSEATVRLLNHRADLEALLAAPFGELLLDGVFVFGLAASGAKTLLASGAKTTARTVDQRGAWFPSTTAPSSWLGFLAVLFGGAALFFDYGFFTRLRPLMQRRRHVQLTRVVPGAFFSTAELLVWPWRCAAPNFLLDGDFILT